MKTFLPFLFLITFLASTALAQQNGKISGTIVSSDQKPAAGISVKLKGTNIGTTTDHKGSYHLTNVKAGNYLLVISCVGLRTEEKRVVVNAKKTVVVDFRLNEDHAMLLEVQVNTGVINKYAKKESATIARMPLKNLENPQVYSVVSKELMNEQMAVDYKAAFKNVPGIIANATPNGATYIRSRGFYTGSFLRNGLASQQYTGLDPINIERVEVLKGPSSTLFGSSLISYGGLVNRVTKKPFDSLAGTVSYTTGSWNLNRITADINTPLNKEKSLLFRINTAANYQHSFQDYGFERSLAVAPSISYQVNEKLSVLLDAEFYRVHRVAAIYHVFGNIPAQSFKDLKLDYKKSLTTDETMIKQGSTNLFGKVEYQMSKNWKSTTAMAYSHTQWDELANVYAYWTSDSTLRRSINFQKPRKFKSYNLQQNFNGEFSTGILKHKFVAGLDAYLYRTQYEFYAAVDYDVVNVNRPVAPLSMARVDQIMVNPTFYKSSQDQYAAYASDVISVADRWFAMLSLRADYFDSKGTSVAGAAPAPLTVYDQKSLSHKLGLIYQPIKEQLSLFASYMNGFQNVAPVSQPDGTTSMFKPQHANQWEGGVKADLLGHKLSATLSYYQIDVSNSTRRTDITLNGIRGFYTFQDGSQRSKGFEVEVIANPVAGLNFIAGYGHNSSKIIKATSAEGKYTATSPRDVANGWLSYKFMNGALKGAGAGLGANYVGESYWDLTNTFKVPSSIVADASVFYDLPKWHLGLKVNNMFSEKAWDINGVPYMRAQVMTNIGFKF